jgi:glucokinase
LLVGDATRGWHVVETEGGHVSFAPLGDEEQAIARWLTARFGRARTNACCAAPACRMHRRGACAASARSRPGPDPPRLRDPAEIVAAALDGHDLPRAARWRASARCSAASPATRR